MLDKVREYVTESFGREYPHLERTLFWIRKLKPDAGEELLIAAVSHDIERAFQPKEDGSKKFSYSWGEAMDRHQVESGKIMFDYLVKEGYDSKKAEKVKELISKHEVGGDAGQNLLKDADSISWLEVSAPKHICKQNFSKEELGKKVTSMYERISSGKAKAIAGPFYEKAVALLDEVE